MVYGCSHTHAYSARRCSTHTAGNDMRLTSIIVCPNHIVIKTCFTPSTVCFSFQSMQVLWSLNPAVKNTRIFARNSAKIGLAPKVYVLPSLQFSRLSIPRCQSGLKDIVPNLLCIKAPSCAIMVQHCVVTSQTMQSFAMTRSVELVELPEKDLIPKGSTVLHGRGSARASTLHQTPPSRTTMQLAIELARRSNTRTLITMQFYCVTLPLEESMTFDTVANTCPDPHPAMTHSMGKARALWEREN